MSKIAPIFFLHFRKRHKKLFLVKKKLVFISKTFSIGIIKSFINFRYRPNLPPFFSFSKIIHYSNVIYSPMAEYTLLWVRPIYLSCLKWDNNVIFHKINSVQICPKSPQLSNICPMPPEYKYLMGAIIGHFERCSNQWFYMILFCIKAKSHENL